jgi:hypothetical protein
VLQIYPNLFSSLFKVARNPVTNRHPLCVKRILGTVNSES